MLVDPYFGTLRIEPRSFWGWEWNCLAPYYPAPSPVISTVPLVKLVSKDLMSRVCGQSHDATEKRHSFDASPDTNAVL